MPATGPFADLFSRPLIQSGATPRLEVSNSKEGAKAMEADIVIAIAMATALVLIVNQLGRVMRAMMLHRTIRKGMTEGSNLTPELLDRVDQEKAGQGFGDDRIGVVLIAIGLAVLGFGLLTGDADDLHNTAGISLFPLLVGAALLGRHLVIRRARDGA
jgi:hypothetical protein